MNRLLLLFIALFAFFGCGIPTTDAFTISTIVQQQQQQQRHNSNQALVGRRLSSSSSSTTRQYATAEDKVAISVTGEQLELLLQEWDQPLVVDAYATWCGPCLLMAPEFEEAAKELKGKVRFAKLDTDKEENMAARLNIMGVPTLLFLDQYVPDEGAADEGAAARAVLKGRIEGALRKQNIIDLCNFYFFNGPEPKLF